MLKLEILSGIWKIDSGISGKIVTVMAGIDGKDNSSVQELMSFMEDIELMNGKIYCVIANPEALKRGVHEIEKSMEQTFLDIPTSCTDEDLRTQDILPYLRESDLLLTLEHNISEEKTESFLCIRDIEWAEFFDVKHIITGLDKLKPARSESYMGSLGKTGLYIGRGNQKKGMTKKEILNLLTATKNIAGYPTLYGKQKRYHFDTILRAPNIHFRFSKKWNNFDTVQAGEPIAYHEQVMIRAPYAGIIAFPKIPTHIGDEMCVFGKEIK